MIPQALTTCDLKERFRGFLPVVIDVETAGFYADKNPILQIGVCFVEMDADGMLKPSDEPLSFEIAPFEGCEINEDCCRFIGINPHDPERQAVSEDTVMREICTAVKKKIKEAKCKRAILVGHNANFDSSFVHAAMKRCKLEKRDPFHPFSTMDTATLAGIFCGHTVLAKACEILGIEYDTAKAHGALYDTVVEAQVFCTIANNYSKLLKAAPDGTASFRSEGNDDKTQENAE